MPLDTPAIILIDPVGAMVVVVALRMPFISIRFARSFQSSVRPALIMFRAAGIGKQER